MKTKRATSSESAEDQDRPDLTKVSFVIVFLLGLPTSGVDAIALAEVASNRGLTREEFWAQVIERNVHQLLECGPEGWSKLDRIFSEAMGKTVSVWGAEPYNGPFGQFELPGLAVDPHQVLDTTGQPATRRLVDLPVLEQIARGLIDFTRAGMSLCAINDGKSEFFLPIEPGIEKEARHA